MSLQSSVKALINDSINLLVTAPINKNNIQSEEFKFPGHTDYLAKELSGESLMFMICDELKVGLLTDHIPLKDINSHITKHRICLLYTSPSPRDVEESRMPSSA